MAWGDQPRQKQGAAGDGDERAEAVARDMEGTAETSTNMPDAGELVDGRYSLLAEIGHGGMGVVYLADDTRLHRRVALKFLRPHANETDVTRFLREARLLASLSHPNVVKVYDLGHWRSWPYFVMEFLDGHTLADVLAAYGSDGLPVDVAVGFGRQLCIALGAVHDQGIIHRDIKPGNVIITNETTAVLMDFGLARKELTAKERGLVSGTPQYLAPEDIRGVPLSGVAAQRSDIYALGITLYELIAGRPPFIDENTAIVLHRQLHEAPQPLCDLRPDVPAAFERVIMRALEKDPTRRQGSCAELISELSDARKAVVRVGLTTDPAMLPLVAPPPKPPQPVAAPRGAAGSAGQEGYATIVAIVGNGDPAREVLVSAVRKALPGCEVATLPSGAMPIQDALVTLVPGCVVIDMDLLDESPLELCGFLRSTPSTAHAAILVIAEALGAEQQRLLLRMGVSGVLTKPFDAAKLALEIQRCIALG